MNMQTSIALVAFVAVGRLEGRAFCSVSPARFAGSSFTYAERSASKAPGPRGMCVGSYGNRSGLGVRARRVVELVGVVK